MSNTASVDSPNDFFQITQTGDCLIVVPHPEAENLASNILELAAEMVLAPLRDQPSGNVIFDLSQIKFFGSEFISFLLRCHLIVKKRGCELSLCGVGERIRELLRQTALDTLWAIYDSRQEALDALMD
jgi:anti-sigma B factor antagonist